MCTGAEPAAAADVGSTLCASSAAAAGTDTLATAGTDALATAGTDTLATAGTDALASGAPGALSLGGSTIAQNAGLASAGLDATAGATGTLGEIPVIDSSIGSFAPLDASFSPVAATPFSSIVPSTSDAASQAAALQTGSSAPSFLPDAAQGATAADSAAAAPTFGQQLGTAAQYANEANSVNNFVKNPSLQSGAGLALSTSNLGSSLSPDGTASAVSAPGAGAGAGGGAGLGSGGDGFQSVVPSTSDAASAAAQQTGSAGTNALGYGMDSATGGGYINPVTPTGPPGFVDKALSALGNMSGHDWINAGSLALGTTALVKQSQGLGSAQRQLNAAAAPAQGVEKQLLNQFQTGQLTGADAQAIAQWTQQQTAQVNQYYEQAGLSNSSMHQAALTQVSQQADQMRQQALNNMLSNGLSAAGVANPLISTGVTAGVQQDQNAMTAMQNFLNTLANMNTQGKTPAPTPTPTGSPGG